MKSVVKVEPVCKNKWCFVVFVIKKTKTRTKYSIWREVEMFRATKVEVSPHSAHATGLFAVPLFLLSCKEAPRYV